MTDTARSLHADGYDDEVAAAVEITETLKAECHLCNWVSQDYEALDWKEAEAEAVEHFRDYHQDPDDDDDDDDAL